MAKSRFEQPPARGRIVLTSNPSERGTHIEVIRRPTPMDDAIKLAIDFEKLPTREAALKQLELILKELAKTDYPR